MHSNQTSSSATDGLAKVGTRAALSFAFAFLKRSWRSGEDSDLCTEVLQQALDVLQELQIPSLFDGQDLSNVWLEVVDRCMEFLKSVCQGLVPLTTSNNLSLSLQRHTSCLHCVLHSNVPQLQHAIHVQIL